MIKFTIAHARALNYCVAGMKGMCDKHSIPFWRFVNDGIPVEELFLTNDPLLIASANFAVANPDIGG